MPEEQLLRCCFCVYFAVATLVVKKAAEAKVGQIGVMESTEESLRAPKVCNDLNNGSVYNGTVFNGTVYSVIAFNGLNLKDQASGASRPRV